MRTIVALAALAAPATSIAGTTLTYGRDAITLDADWLAETTDGYGIVVFVLRDARSIVDDEELAQVDDEYDVYVFRGRVTTVAIRSYADDGWFTSGGSWQVTAAAASRDTLTVGPTGRGEMAVELHYDDAGNAWGLSTEPGHDWLADSETWVPASKFDPTGPVVLGVSRKLGPVSLLTADGARYTLGR